jgi:hypothetical protein
VCAVNTGYERLWMCRGWRCLRSSSSRWHPADTGDVQEALDTRETQAVGSGERGGGGAVAVGGDQVGDVALIEEVAQALRMLRARCRGAGRVGESRGVAKPQVSGLNGVRVGGEYLHPRTRRSLTWAFVMSKCASPCSLCRPLMAN